MRGEIEQAADNSMTARLQRWYRNDRIVAIVIAVVVAAVFARTINGGLYLDDMHHARPWTASEVFGTFHGPFDPLGIEPDYFRPLVVVSFAIDWNLFGYNAVGYHAVSVLFYAIVAALVFLFARRIGIARLSAIVGALTFAVLPANVASASYISERSDPLALMFILIALMLVVSYHGSRRVGLLIGAWAAFVMALLSKEIGIALAVMIVPVWLFVSYTARLEAAASIDGATPSPWRELRSMFTDSTMWKGLARLVVPFWVIAVAYILYRQRVVVAGSLSYEESYGPIEGLIRAVITAFKGVPWELSPLALVPLALLFVAAALAGGTRGWSEVVLGVALVVAGSIPLSNVGPVEPRLLLVALLGYAIAVAGLVTVFTQRWSMIGSRRLALVGLATAALWVAFGAATLVGLVKAQNLFMPGSYKMLDGDLTIWNDPVERDLYPPYHLERIEERLREAGLIP
jgi:hypothetical protein